MVFSNNSSHDGEGDSFYEYLFTDVIYYVRLYYVPAIIITGFVGNLRSIAVFLQPSFKVRSTIYYLTVLSVADTGFLATLLLVWLNNIIGVQLFNKEGSCEALVYISSLCDFLSVWLTVSFTVDRFIAAQYPKHGLRMCTMARTKEIVNYLTVVTLFLQVYSFVTAGKVKQHDGSELCDMLEEGGEIMINISIIYILVTQIIPLILIVIMNAMIVRKLLEFRKLAGTNQETATPEEEMSLERLNINLNQINNYHPEPLPPETPLYNRNNQRNVFTLQEQNTTKMLLVISTLSVLLNLPNYAIRICLLWHSLWHQQISPLMWCLQQFFMLLYYTNFSIKFTVYLIRDYWFRKKFIYVYDCNPGPYNF